MGDTYNFGDNSNTINQKIGRVGVLDQSHHVCQSESIDYSAIVKKLECALQSNELSDVQKMVVENARDAAKAKDTGKLKKFLEALKKETLPFLSSLASGILANLIAK